MSLTLGIDVGGTKIAAALVDPSTGRVVRRGWVPSPSTGTGALVVLHDLAMRMTESEIPAAIGIGVPEIVAPDGAITSASNWNWKSGEIRSALSELAPVWIESDVRAAALAEARFGSGVGLGHFVYLTIGTNISASFVQNGQPLTGRVGAALVVGVPPIEEVAGGRALARAAGMRGAADVIDDPRHSDLVSQAAIRLGDEAARIVNLLDPDALVVGGSLGFNESYRRRWVERMRESIWHPAASQVPVLEAGLGANSGAVGAALSAHLRFAA